MCKSPLHDLIHALPKCEHHLHIEGTLSPELLFSLAAANGVSLPSDDPSFASPEALRRRYASFASLDDFLHYYFVGFSALVTASDFERLAYAYLEEAYGHGLRHAEVFFDPQAHADRGVAYATVVAGLCAARQRAAQSMPRLTVAFIPCVVRHLPVSSGMDMLSHIVQSGHFRDGTVVGFGLSSTEKGMHPSLFAPLYDAARDAGVANLTAHYGEEGPASYVDAALSDLRVARIDHGRRVTEDPDVLRRVAQSGTLLTLCPVSNVVLKGVASVSDIPIRALLDAGVRFSINTDDPAYFGGNLLDNYCAVQDAFDLSVAEWERVARQSIDGSWCDDERKRVLHASLDDVIAPWQAA